MTYHDSLFGIFATEADMIAALRERYPDRSWQRRLIVQLIALIWPTLAHIRFIEACRSIREYEARTRV